MIERNGWNISRARQKNEFRSCCVHKTNGTYKKPVTDDKKAWNSFDTWNSPIA